MGEVLGTAVKQASHEVAPAPLAQLSVAAPKRLPRLLPKTHDCRMLNVAMAANAAENR